MEEKILVKRIYRAEVEGNKRGLPNRRRMDEAKGCLSDSGLIIPEAKECVNDRREWRRIIGEGGGDVDDPGRSRLYETVKAVDVFYLLRSGFDSSEG